jgi:energy-coupling factor transport system substrate-specific component
MSGATLRTLELIWVMPAERGEMFSGAQVSLYPMSDDFVGIILGSIEALDPWRVRLRIETDDVSTLIVGPPEILFPRCATCSSRRRGRACIARCMPPSRAAVPASPTIRSARRRWPAPPAPPCPSGSRPRARPWQRRRRPDRSVAAQFSLYPLGLGHHMDEIYGCIEFLKGSGTFDRSKNFCTKLRGDAGPGVRDPVARPSPASARRRAMSRST